MKKARFFYGYYLTLVAALGGLVFLNQAVAGKTKERTAWAEQAEKDAAAEKEKFLNTENSEAKTVNSSGQESGQAREKVKSVSAAEDIRVLLTTTDFASYYHPSVTVEADGEQTTWTPEEVAAAKDQRVRISAGEEGVKITSVQRQCGTPVYQGSLELRPGAGGILVINQLPLEEYLKSVVPSEMPASYDMEALKAQAICARTYAVKQREEHRLESLGADVDDSVNYQVYGNIAVQETSTEAVEETKGQVLCQNGEPIEAYYFSTSAGVTSTDEIWGAEEAASWLKSVPCSFDSDQPWSRWQVRIPWDVLQSAAAAHLGQEGALLDVAVTKRQESGAVTGMNVVTEAGSFTLNEEYEIRQFLSPSGCMITEKNGAETEGGALLPSAYFDLTLNNGVSVTVTGRGYGHGVGMSQTAANEMAKQGYTCEEILDYFFKNVEIDTAE